MIDNAKAIIIGLGSIGTSWEFMEIMVKIQLLKKSPIPFIVLSQKEAREYPSFIGKLMDEKLLSASMCQYVNVTNSPDKAIALISMSFAERKKDPTNLCQVLHK